MIKNYILIKMNIMILINYMQYELYILIDNDN